MLKIFYTSSENDNKFGVSKVVNSLTDNLNKKKIRVKFSNNILDFFFFKPNIVHIHGCWKLHLLIIFIFCKIVGIKTIISPHGMIDPFSFSQKKIKKKIAWFLYQRFIFFRSDLIIVNSKQEKKNLLNRFHKKKKIIIINHGISLSKNFNLKDYKNKDLKFVFFSKIHPSKNLMHLIKIWKSDKFFNKFSVHLYGEILDNEYYLKIKDLIKSNKNIRYKGKLNRNIQNKLRIYDFFLHPSKSENFGLVVIEALSSGLYVIINNKLDWKILDELGYGISIDFNKNQLKKTILKLRKKKNYLTNIKSKKKRLEFVKTKYNWKNIIKEYTLEYENLKFKTF